jgi:hypothetical protein
MYNRILSYIIIIAGSLSFLVSCSEDDDNEITHFTTKADVTNSYQYSVFNSETSAVEKYHLVMLFSTDGGTTYAEYPAIKVGQNYKVKIVHRTSDGDLPVSTSDACLKFDWSASNPAPTSATDGETAEFQMKSQNDIVAKISDYKPYNAASWLGVWYGDEVGAGVGGTDKNTIRADATIPNKFIMNNYFADGVDVYFTLNPSTIATDQTLTIPEQTTSEGGVATGTGSYDQCRGTFTVNTTYKIDWGDGTGTHTYKWQYYFYR